MKRFSLLLLSLVSLSAHSDEWTKMDTMRELTYQVANVADAYQTSRFRFTDVSEVNPVTRSIIGAKPSTRDTAMYFATLGISHYLISRALPSKWRPYWQGSTAMASSWAVYNNSQL